MTEPEQQHLVNTALDRWVPTDPNQPTNYAAIEEVSRGTAANNPATGALIADTYAQRSAQLAASAPADGTGVNQQKQAATLAVGAVDASRTPEGQRALLDRAGISGSEQLASALTRNLSQPSVIQPGFSGDPANADERNHAVNQLLQATTKAPPNDATNAFVDGAFRGLPNHAYRGERQERKVQDDRSKVETPRRAAVDLRENKSDRNR